ncbi:inactive leucine-rich repeat receptor-like protein kinase CORYNE [Silene latifolia]|uniref:inactive leucine-rich repeat receptor-like protein kinase CORYNE n=1 Tax=Silene latifolia TaxID=37657 RepID=UPI003D7726D4
MGLLDMLKKSILLFCLISYVHGFPIKYMLKESTSSTSPTISTGSDFIRIGVKRVSLSISLGLVSGFVTAVFVAAIVRCFVHYINRTPILKGPVVFSPKIDPTTLKLALDNENQLLGSSPNGTYYRTALDNGLTIAVKKLELFETNDKVFKRKLQQDLEVIAKLRHRHLMSLRAYVRESGSFSLIYDYMPTGSLEDAMNRVRENQLQMGWDVRHRIAVGIIKGLKFLHFECDPSVLHYNLKPGNVMLDAEFEAKLADFGLAKLMPKLYQSHNGYRAPDFSQNCRYTDKSDVFSFGVILAVLLTGRDPLDPFFGEASSGGSLGMWLRHMQQAGEARKALDKSILGQDDEEDEMLMAVRIAVVCMSDHPEDRPCTDELVPMLSRLHSF